MVTPVTPLHLCLLLALHNPRVTKSGKWVEVQAFLLVLLAGDCLPHTMSEPGKVMPRFQGWATLCVQEFGDL